jgi:hypothetical protein
MAVFLALKNTKYEQTNKTNQTNKETKTQFSF